MQGKSCPFWFEVMDVDEDGKLSYLDIVQYLKECHSDKENQTSVWIELCDMCHCSPSKAIPLSKIVSSKAGPFCFQHCILQNGSFTVCLQFKNTAV